MEKIYNIIAKALIEENLSKINSESELIEFMKNAVDEAEVFDYNGNETEWIEIDSDFKNVPNDCRKFDVARLSKTGHFEIFNSELSYFEVLGFFSSERYKITHFKTIN